MGGNDFIKSIIARKERVIEFKYQAVYKNECMPISRVNKTKKTFALSHDDGELVISSSEIDGVKGYME